MNVKIFRGGVATRSLAVATVAIVWFGAASAQTLFSNGFEPSVPSFPQSDAEAARFLTQATFGPTEADIQHLRSVGYNAWLNEQFALPPSYQVPYLDYVDSLGEPVYHNARMEAWWMHAVQAPDQLRQRIAYALSQIFVISDQSDAIGGPYAVAYYYDLLIANAFANYRNTLETVTKSPAMGAYLSMLGNRAPDLAQNIRPDENYAREIMQLFSIGLIELNSDGTPILMGPDPVPTYDQFQIKAFAHVFTGWHFGNCTGFDFCFPGYPEAIGWEMPMQPFSEYHHIEVDADPDNDVLLMGVMRPAGGTPESNLDFALDNIFQHPNVGPFIARRLIQNLVTSNPSPEYIERMTAVFDNNGSGVRGDMQALVRAILMDEEARLGHQQDPMVFGKVREPVLRQTHLWRAFSAESEDGRYRNWNPEFAFGQGPMRAPSVFNFFLPDYQPPGEVEQANLFAPEIQIITETFATRTDNSLFWQAAIEHEGSPGEPYFDEGTIILDLAPFMPMASSPANLVDRLNVLLMNGQMSSFMRTTLINYLTNIPFSSGDDTGGRVRTWEAIHLIMTSPEYIVQK